MAERFVPLSTVEYFTQGNTMMGSVTPEDFVANPLAKIFNYRVWEQDGELVAEVFIDNRCYDLTDRDKIVRAVFEMSEQGIDDAAAWLHDVYRAYEPTIYDEENAG